MKKYIKPVSSILAISLGIGYGLSEIVPFSNAFVLTVIGISVYWFNFRGKYDDSSEVEKMLEESDGVIALQEKTIMEQMEVIQEYEKIFDDQLTELDCVCGGNTFQGIFVPGVENIVECEKCDNKYKVLVSFDSILISQPLENDTVMPDIETQIKNKN